MKNFTYLPILFMISLCACTSLYKKGDKGFEYRIVPGGTNKKLEYGNFIQFHLKQMYRDNKKDTVLGDTRNYLARIETFDSAMAPLYFKIFSEAEEGDSIVMRILTDSAYKDKDMPPYMSKGGYLYTTVKIFGVFKNNDQVDSARKAELKTNGLKAYTNQLNMFEKEIEKNRPQIESDSKIIAAYLDKNNLKYKRGKWGTFIVVREEGKGEKVGYSSVIAVNYTGKTLDSGKVFDSNLDPKFDHEGTLEVPMRQLGSVIPGWTDALSGLNEGAKVTLYIPSSLAYGKKGRPNRIGPDANIVFDIEIVKVLTEDQALEIVSQNRRRREALGKHLADSIKKAQQ